MTNRELLRILAESQTLLNKATESEECKRTETSGSELKRELAKLSQAARDAHAQASAQMGDLEGVIRNARNGINGLMEADRGKEKREDNVVYEQINKAVDNMTTAHQTACKEIEHNLERLGTFNITLFGKTLSGKSTLMEILTKGSGKSIGKGAQRTTRDVREYTWNGMRITDTPGVAAFGGETDEDAAYAAAMQSDLITFLIADEPQPTEVEHFARLRKTDKPMLGICNVKKICGKQGPDQAVPPGPGQVVRRKNVRQTGGPVQRNGGKPWTRYGNELQARPPAVPVPGRPEGVPGPSDRIGHGEQVLGHRGPHHRRSIKERPVPPRGGASARARIAPCSKSGNR